MRAVLIGLGVIVVIALLLFGQRAGTTETERDDLAQSTANLAQGYTNLADQIRGECAAGRLAGPICQTAADAVVSPEVVAGRQGLPGAVGAQGAQGAVGPAGPIGPAGRDGERGPEGVPGTPGTPGEPGTPGRDGTDGSDGASGADGGLGPQGRGVASARSENCRWTVTYTDGTSEDAGPSCADVITPPPTTEPPPVTQPTTEAPPAQDPGVLDGLLG